MSLFQNPPQPSDLGQLAERPLILVVEDQPALQDMLYWALHLQGFRPTCVANGQEALEWMAQAVRLGLLPAVIMLDVHMPIMDGASFLRCLRTQWSAPFPVPPVVLLTVDKRDYEYLECDDVLIKPFHIDELCTHLRKVLSDQSARTKPDARLNPGKDL